VLITEGISHDPNSIGCMDRDRRSAIGQTQKGFDGCDAGKVSCLCMAWISVGLVSQSRRQSHFHEAKKVN
jgi:hypothetical protein